MKKHIDCKWVLLYVQRWLTAPLQLPDGCLVERDKGTPQGGFISPLLANLFLHYAFDKWMQKEFPSDLIQSISSFLFRKTPQLSFWANILYAFASHTLLSPNAKSELTKIAIRIFGLMLNALLSSSAFSKICSSVISIPSMFETFNYHMVMSTVAWNMR